MEMLKGPNSCVRNFTKREATVHVELMYLYRGAGSFTGQP